MPLELDLPEYLSEPFGQDTIPPDETDFDASTLSTGLRDVRAVNTLLREGPGVFGYYKDENRFGTEATVAALVEVGRVWSLRRLTPRIGVGDLSKEGGGDIPGHVSHETGRDADIRPIATGNYEGPLTWESPNYSRQLTQELVDLLYCNGIVQVKMLFFNDPSMNGTAWWKSHDNHLHVRFFFIDERPGFPVLQLGKQQLPAVREMQRRLNSWIYQSQALAPLPVDGSFGQLTQTALLSFQQALELKADGIAGQETWAASLNFLV